jgi:putative nucleotidyltransferase with HDIG domain
VIIITGQQNLEPAIQAIRRGTYDHISKPFSPCRIEETGAAEEWRSRTRYRYYQDHLESLVSRQTEALQETTREIERVHDAAVQALGAALDLKDPETEEHCRRVAQNSVRLGKERGLSKEQLRNLKWSAYLHDIGKIGVPEHVLGKTTSLEPQEMEIVKSHAMMGFRMISSIGFLKDATDVVLYHMRSMTAKALRLRARHSSGGPDIRGHRRPGCHHLQPTVPQSPSLFSGCRGTEAGIGKAFRSGNRGAVPRDPGACLGYREDN